MKHFPTECEDLLAGVLLELAVWNLPEALALCQLSASSWSFLDVSSQLLLQGHGCVPAATLFSMVIMNSNPLKL